MRHAADLARRETEARASDLRHSRLATTMDLNIHAYEEDLREAVNTLDRTLGS